MFQKSQDDDYVALCVERAEEIYLTWVEQFLDIIQARLDVTKPLVLNDIGCNCGQFWKGLARRKWNIQYRGYDIEEAYLREVKKIFPEIADSVSLFDITAMPAPSADISVLSATLEHLEYLSPGLDNILKSTQKLVVMRTFLGEATLKAIFKKTKAHQPYFVNQYSFLEILDLFERYGFETDVVRDRYTDSMPRYLGQGLVRSQYVVVGKKNER